MNKIINIALIFTLIEVFLCQGISYSSQDALLRMPVGSNSTYARLSSGYELSRIRQAIEQIVSEIEEGASCNPYKLAEELANRCSLRVIKRSGKKLLLISSDSQYIVKINHEEDFAYEKEKAFFMHGYNPLPETRLLYANDKAKICIFDNIFSDSDALLLFKYMHTSNISREQLLLAMRYAAGLCAKIHKAAIIGQDMPIYRDQGFDEQQKRAAARINYLRSVGYSDDLPDSIEFMALIPQVKDDRLVLNHGDFSPWNIFVDPWTGEPVGLIDCEASSIGARSKELAKVIISLLDARKNNPILIKDFDKMLSEFLSTYFRESGANAEEILSSIPYYLATQLLWYAEGTERTFKNRSWVKWRIELCRWALSQKTFSVSGLIDFIEKEARGNNINRPGDLTFITETGHEGASGRRFKVRTGKNVRFSIAMDFTHPANTILAANEISAEFWTDANTGIWHSEGPLEFTGMNNGKAYFAGDLAITEPSGDNTPYGVTARVSLSPGNQRDWRFIDIPHGNALIEAEAGDVNQDIIKAWVRSLNAVYGGVMLDFDGTVKFYNGEVPMELQMILIDILNKGIHVSISSSRSDGREIGSFFTGLKEKARQNGKDFDLNLCPVYLKNGKSGYNVGTGEVYYDFRINRDVKDAIRRILSAEEFSRFLYPGSYVEDEYRVTFTFRGGVGRELFARRINEALKDLGGNVSQQIVALYTDDLFEISPRQGTKNTSLNHFSSLIGIPVKHIVRIGDQGQLYGIDEGMIDSPGGFSAYHANPESIYPLSIPAMASKRNANATTYLLKRLRFSKSLEAVQVEAASDALFSIASVKEKGFIQDDATMHRLEGYLDFDSEDIKIAAARTIIEEVILQTKEAKKLRLKALKALKPYLKIDRDSRIYGQVDLHTHTHFSDGYQTSTALIVEAYEKGLSAIAVTDHYALISDEAVEAADILEVNIICGIEVSCNFESRDTHILIHFADKNRVKNISIESSRVMSKMAEQIRENSIRAEKIRRNMKEFLGAEFEVSREELQAVSRGEIVPLGITQALGRKNLALLQKLGYDDPNVFFVKYIKPNQSIYEAGNLDNFPTIEEAANLAQELGGKLVLAHPNELDVDAEKAMDKMKRIIEILAPSRLLAGVEFYSHKLRASGLQDRVREIIDYYNQNHPVYKERNIKLLPGSDSHGKYSLPKQPLGNYADNYPQDPSDVNNYVAAFFQKSSERTRASLSSL